MGVEYVGAEGPSYRVLYFGLIESILYGLNNRFEQTDTPNFWLKLKKIIIGAYVMSRVLAIS